MSLKILYNIVSPPSRSVLILADKLNLKLEKQVINLGKGENYTPEFKKLNPQQSVPVLIDNGVPLRESRSIMTYLCNTRAPNSPLYPTDPLLRQHVEAGLYLDANHIFGSFGPLLRTIILERRKPPENLLEFADANMTRLECVLSEPENKFVAGDFFSLGDIALIPSVTTFMKFNLIDWDDKPKIKEWVERCKPEIDNWEEYVEHGGEVLKNLLTKLIKK